MAGVCLTRRRPVGKVSDSKGLAIKVPNRALNWVRLGRARSSDPAVKRKQARSTETGGTRREGKCAHGTVSAGGSPEPPMRWRRDHADIVSAVHPRFGGATIGLVTMNA